MIAIRSGRQRSLVSAISASIGRQALHGVVRQ